MNKPTRTLAAAALLAWSAFAAGQVPALTPGQLAAQQVLGLAPQLAAFAGSPANFQALASGLVLGQPIVLTATGADGVTQLVTITPGAGMSALQAAQLLERTRQTLISSGIGAPTPEQIGAALNVGSLQVQRQAASPATFAASANTQNVLNGLMTGAPIVLSGTGANGLPTTLTFTAPGGAMTGTEAAQTLQLANQLLALLGVASPTPEQLRAALVGGTIDTAAGQAALRGVLEGRGTVQTAISTFGTSFTPPAALGTSASPTIGTSFSPTTSTSATPVLGTSASPTVVPRVGVAGGAGTASGTPSAAVRLQGRR